MVWVVFDEKSQETQGNIMVWLFFYRKKMGNTRTYDGLDDFVWA